MSVNPHDDYEKLAKLLYPSIEASGNVYYGQTRKLTLDAILNRNDLGFESWIKSQPVSTYDESDPYVDSTFEWKLGPLHGSIAFIPFIHDEYNYNYSDIYSFYNFPDTMWFKVISPYADEDDFILWPKDEYIENNEWSYEDAPAKDLTSNCLYGTIFAKYKINTNCKNIEHVINSGNYETYEHSIDTSFVCMCITNRFNPVDRDDYSISDRHFFIGKESNGEYYLYIKVCTSKEGYLNYYNLPIRQELTFTAVSASARVGLQKSNDNSIFAIYQYSLDSGSTWNDYTFGTLIDLEMHQNVRFRMSNPNDFYYDENTYVYFIFNQSGIVEASGDIRSMLDPLNSYMPHKFAFYRMFYNDSQLITAPKIPITICSQSDLKCILKETFLGTSIKEPPKLLPIVGFVDEYQLSSSEECYHSTFENCKQLTRAPKFLYREPMSSFKDMLKGCSSLKEIDVSQCISSGSMTFDYTIYDAGHNNVTLIHSTPSYSLIKWENLFNTNSSWKFEFIDVNRSSFLDEFFTSLNEDTKQLITNGSNSPLNGRGDLLDSTTIGNMEKSFDENSTHEMNTYNSDGSFNQEIWGYKTFNSPVKFRNGLYGEDWSIYNINVSNDPRVYNRSVVISNDMSTSASIQIGKLSGSSSGVTNSIILSTEKPDSNNAAATIEIKSEGTQIGGVNNSGIKLNANTIKLATDNTYIDLDNDSTYINNVPILSNYITNTNSSGFNIGAYYILLLNISDTVPLFSKLRVNRTWDYTYGWRLSISHKSGSITSQPVTGVKQLSIDYSASITSNIMSASSLYGVEFKILTPLVSSSTSKCIIAVCTREPGEY